MHLEIITPDQRVFSGEVVSAKFPGSKGSFQVLNNHAPLISLLERGKITFRTAAQNEQSVMVDGGMVEVLNNRIIVLAEAVLS